MTPAGVLGIFADVYCTGGAALAIWSYLYHLNQKMMTGALWMVAVSLVFTTVQEIYLHRPVATGLSCAALSVIALLTWRCWPDGWNPWRELRGEAEQLRTRGRAG